MANNFHHNKILKSVKHNRNLIQFRRPEKYPNSTNTPILSVKRSSGNILEMSIVIVPRSTLCSLSQMLPQNAQ